MKKEINSKELGKFERWLRSPKNKKEFEELKKVWERLDKVNIELDLEKEWNLVKNKIDSEKLHSFLRAGYLIRFLKKAWFLLLVISLLTTVWLYISKIEKNRFGESKFIEVKTARREIARVILPDSSVVILNSLSKVVYPEKFSFTGRIVEFEGEAYFAVRSDKSTPFCVKTGGIVTLVAGTSFNIRYRDEEYSLYVDNGAVIILDRRQNQALKASAGEFVIASEDEGIKGISQSKRDLHVMWMMGKIVFEKKRLLEVLKELQNYYDFDFVFARGDLANRRISGEFSRELTIEKILKAVAFSVGAEVEFIYPKQNDRVRMLVKIK